MQAAEAPNPVINALSTPSHRDSPSQLRYRFCSAASEGSPGEGEPRGDGCARRSALPTNCPARRSRLHRRGKFRWLSDVVHTISLPAGGGSGPTGRDSSVAACPESDGGHPHLAYRWEMGETRKQSEVFRFRETAKPCFRRKRVLAWALEGTARPLSLRLLISKSGEKKPKTAKIWRNLLRGLKL